VPTLAEALGVCKGLSKVIVELKSYGHDQRLEERVAAIVEAAGMQEDCIFMSLDHAMVGRMKALRPGWRCGVLAAQAMGDLLALPADFLAVRTAMATPRFVRRAHATGRDVYVWTANDPAVMLGAMSRGVDGLITDRPDVARRVVARRAGMNDAQRVLVALLVRMGASTETLVSADALRP
jgi:glycerophosphoryl diester phosphodiesterase